MNSTPHTSLFCRKHTHAWLKAEVWRVQCAFHVISCVIFMRSCCVFDSPRLLTFPLLAVYLRPYRPVFPPGHQLFRPRCGGQIPYVLLLMRTLAPLPSTTLSHIFALVFNCVCCLPFDTTLHCVLRFHKSNTPCCLPCHFSLVLCLLPCHCLPLHDLHLCHLPNGYPFAFQFLTLFNTPVFFACSFVVSLQCDVHASLVTFFSRAVDGHLSPPFRFPLEHSCQCSCVCWDC